MDEKASQVDNVFLKLHKRFFFFWLKLNCKSVSDLVFTLVYLSRLSKLTI